MQLWCAVIEIYMNFTASQRTNFPYIQPALSFMRRHRDVRDNDADGDLNFYISIDDPVFRINLCHLPFKLCIGEYIFFSFFISANDFILLILSISSVYFSHWMVEDLNIVFLFGGKYSINKPILRCVDINIMLFVCKKGIPKYFVNQQIRLFKDGSKLD